MAYFTSIRSASLWEFLREGVRLQNPFEEESFRRLKLLDVNRFRINWVKGFQLNAGWKAHFLAVYNDNQGGCRSIPGHESACHLQKMRVAVYAAQARSKKHPCKKPNFFPKSCPRPHENKKARSQDRANLLKWRRERDSNPRWSVNPTLA